MLSEGQEQFFDTFGFPTLRKVFTPVEMATIKQESDEIFGEGLGTKLDTGRVALQPFFKTVPERQHVISFPQPNSISVDG